MRPLPGRPPCWSLGFGFFVRSFRFTGQRQCGHQRSRADTGVKQAAQRESRVTPEFCGREIPGSRSWLTFSVRLQTIEGRFYVSRDSSLIQLGRYCELFPRVSKSFKRSTRDAETWASHPLTACQSSVSWSRTSSPGTCTYAPALFRLARSFSRRAFRASRFRWLASFFLFRSIARWDSLNLRSYLLRRDQAKLPSSSTVTNRNYIRPLATYVKDGPAGPVEKKPTSSKPAVRSGIHRALWS